MCNTSSVIFDIAVVGAGPAASTFARESARTGRSIVMIDGQSVTSDKPCGGLLAPDAQKLMAGYDFVLPKEVLVDPQIFSVKTIDLASGIVRSYQRYYMNMDRRRFDDYLLSLVPNKVARLQTRCRRVSRTHDGTFELETTDGHTVRSRYIVGADGASSLIRRTFFDAPILKYIAIQQWFREIGVGSPYYSCIFDPETSESCSWIIHKDGYVIFGGCFSRSGGRAAFDRQKERVESFLGVSFGEAAKTEACLAASPRHMSDFVTGEDGVFLIGEAAGFISASSLEGLSSAMMSGELLAEAFVHDDPATIAGKYRRACAPLKRKLYRKVLKHKILFTPWMRRFIMKSGIQSISTKNHPFTAK